MQHKNKTVTKAPKTLSERLAENQRSWTKSDLDHYYEMIKKLDEIKRQIKKAGPPVVSPAPYFNNCTMQKGDTYSRQANGLSLELNTLFLPST